MNLDTYHYYRNRMHREEVQRDSHRQHLGYLALEGHLRTPLAAVQTALLALWVSFFR